MGPNINAAPQNAKNCASVTMGNTWAPNFDVTLGTMLRNVASYVRTAPLAKLTSIAERRVENTSRRKASWAGDNADAGGKTSWLNGGAEASSGAISSDATGHERPEPDKSRSTDGGDGDAAAPPEADEKAAPKNLAEDPVRQKTGNQENKRIPKGKGRSYN